MADAWGGAWGSSWGSAWGAGVVIILNVAPIVGRVLVYPALQGDVSIDPLIDDARVVVYPALDGTVRRP